MARYFEFLSQLYGFHLTHPRTFAVAVNEKISHLSIKSQKSFMVLGCDASLKIKFEALPLPDFWIYIPNE
jgi:hypothetical protein